MKRKSNMQAIHRRRQIMKTMKVYMMLKQIETDIYRAIIIWLTGKEDNSQNVKDAAIGF